MYGYVKQGFGFAKPTDEAADGWASWTITDKIRIVRPSSDGPVTIVFGDNDDSTYAELPDEALTPLARALLAAKARG